MDKYQEFLLDNIGDNKLEKLGYFTYIQTDLFNNSNNLNGAKSFVIDRINNSITLTQSENPNELDYTIIICKSIYKQDVFSSIEYLKNNKWVLAETILFDGHYSNRQFYTIPTSFKDKVEKIKLHFAGDLVDDLEINIIYESITKEQEKAYYENEKRQKRDALIAKTDIKIATGVDLVNIYFQPCSDKYDHSQIFLYKDGFMIAKYKVEEEMFFKSISGLAVGRYEFILKQFDSKGELIIESNKQEFYIKNPTAGLGKNTVIIRW